jgi:hypothetical protein
MQTETMIRPEWPAGAETAFGALADFADSAMPLVDGLNCLDSLAWHGFGNAWHHERIGCD